MIHLLQKYRQKILRFGQWQQTKEDFYLKQKFVKACQN